MKLSTDKMMLSATAMQSKSKPVLVFLNSWMIAGGNTIYQNRKSKGATQLI